MKSKNALTYVAIGIVVVVIGGLFIIKRQGSPGPLDGLAQCIKDSGAVFYGAFWCPHCQSQKKSFGRSEKYLPYVECSTPNGQGQTVACIEKKIESYPTWTFADGSTETGALSIERLAEKTGCTLPPKL
ncbi:MAG: hypothetical protein AAB408_04195 [Patescibacteria group bacterium]